MTNHPRKLTNAQIREEIIRFISENELKTEFSTDELATRIQAKITKARINNRRVGSLLKEFNPVLVERLGQIYPPIKFYQRREVFWRIITKPGKGVA